MAGRVLRSPLRGTNDAPQTPVPMCGLQPPASRRSGNKRDGADRRTSVTHFSPPRARIVRTAPDSARREVEAVRVDYPDAAALFEELVLAEEPAEFLALIAYPLLDRTWCERPLGHAVQRVPTAGVDHVTRAAFALTAEHDRA